jgi:hypothetical protein
MKEIIVVINTGSPYSSENLEKKFVKQVNDINDEKLILKAIEDSLKKFKIAKLLINIGFIKIFHHEREIYNSDFIGISDKFVYSKTISHE